MSIDKVIAIMINHGIICKKVGDYDILLLDVYGNVYGVVSWIDCLIYDGGVPYILKHWLGY